MNDKTRAAMQQALEALDVLLTEPMAKIAADKAEALLLRAAPALRKALAEQAEQEPVAWMEDSIEFYASDKPSSIFTIPLYAAPVDAKAIRALKLVYDNSTSHDWPEDIWNAIVDALYEEHRKTMATYAKFIQVDTDRIIKSDPLYLQGRAEALEEAAKWLKESGLIGSNDCAAAIRGLK